MRDDITFHEVALALEGGFTQELILRANLGEDKCDPVFFARVLCLDAQGWDGAWLDMRVTLELSRIVMSTGASAVTIDTSHLALHASPVSVQFTTRCRPLDNQQPPLRHLLPGLARTNTR